MYLEEQGIPEENISHVARILTRISYVSKDYVTYIIISSIS
jgi:hypothetical protein